MKVELGSGATTREGWVGIDVNPSFAGIVGDALFLPFATGAVDELRAVDVLEHISYRDTDLALEEWARVLRPGGELYVQVPDAERIMRWFVHDEDRLMMMDTGVCSPLQGAEWRLLGGHADGKYVNSTDDWRWNAHFSLWSIESLAHALVVAGFNVRSIESNGHPNVLCTAVRAA